MRSAFPGARDFAKKECLTFMEDNYAIAVVVATTRPFSETLRRPSRGALFFVVLGKDATTGATRRDATGDDAGVQVHASRARQRVRDVAPRGRPSPGTVRRDASARSRISAESRPNGNFEKTRISRA